MEEDRTPVIIKMIRQSYLALTPAEELTLAREVAVLLRNLDILASLPAAGGLPPPTVTAEELRPDVIAPSLSPDEALANAPASHDNFISVPKIISRPEDKDDE